MCFPGILKGALLVRSRKITDSMAICCAHSIADYSEKKGIDTEHIVVTMEDTDIFAVEAADVAMKAIEEGVARITMTWQEVYDRAKADISHSRHATALLQKEGFIKEPPQEMLDEALEYAVSATLSARAAQ